MSARGIWLILGSAGLTAAGNLLMRAGLRAAGTFTLTLRSLLPQAWALIRQPMFVTGVLLYGFASILWFSVIAVEDLSASYPMLVSLVFILVTAGAIFFFHELISLQKLAGIVVVLTGILLIARA